MTRRISQIIGALGLLALPAVMSAAEPSFSDVSVESPSYAAVEELKERGILSGYSDGTFQLGKSVNRAEMIKIIVANKGGSGSSTTGLQFRDVPADSWYAPYVAEAVSLGLIDGPTSQASFRPEDPVTRAETLKMLLSSYEIDAASNYAEILYPLASDASDSSDWFYPYLRYALTASAVQAEGGKLRPDVPMTRGATADMLYRFILYTEGKQTQTLLSATENEVLNTLQLINSGVTDAARQAAARAILTARGALSSRPDDAVSKAAVKTAEGAMALTDAATAIANGDIQKAIDHSSTAWHLGSKAIEFSTALKALDLQLQNMAMKMADTARSTQ
jgi:hypothetical protein